MARWVLRASGVNFGATIYDTNDLSTTRGASLALLQIEKAVEAVLDAKHRSDQVYKGASQCAYRFDAETADAAEAVRTAVEDRLRRAPGAKEPPFRHLCFVVDVAPCTGEEPGPDDPKDPALEVAEARNLTRQFRSWTAPPQRFSQTAVDADPLEQVRPGTVPSRLPPGKILHDKDDSAPGSPMHALSESVAFRREYGRRERWHFYLDELGDTTGRSILQPDGKHFYFASEFQDIVADPPYGVPLSLRSKIAVVYMDGNRFGRIRERLPIGRFARELRALRRGLLESVLRWYVRSAASQDWSGPPGTLEDAGNPFAVVEYGRWGLRLETLLWGGDECTFVVPAWLAVPFVTGLFAATRDWQIGGSPLTHAVGVAIAHHKVPIRQLQAIARAAADGAKDAGLRDRNTVTFEIFESLAPPDTELAPARAHLYGMPPGCTEGHERLARWLALPGDAMGTLTGNLRTLATGDGGEPFPRSQLYAALRAAKAAGDLTGADAAKAFATHLAHFGRRKESAESVDRLHAMLPPQADPDGPRPLPVDLALLAQFWDYADPLTPRVQPFGPPPAEGGAA